MNIEKATAIADAIKGNLQRYPVALGEIGKVPDDLTTNHDIIEYTTEVAQQLADHKPPITDLRLNTTLGAKSRKLVYFASTLTHE